jgi:hypothetical protein
MGNDHHRRHRRRKDNDDNDHDDDNNESEDNGSEEEDDNDDYGDEEEDDNDDKDDDEDPDGLRKATAALLVNAGPYHDPPHLQGLSHFLEHMLFLGMEDYLEENAFNKFLSGCGGDDNAYTGGCPGSFVHSIINNRRPPVIALIIIFALQHTLRSCQCPPFFCPLSLRQRGRDESSAADMVHMLYHYCIPQDSEKNVWKALNMFSSFFKCPLLNKGLTERELNAVKSKFELNKKEDNNRLAQLMSHTCRINGEARITGRERCRCRTTMGDNSNNDARGAAKEAGGVGGGRNETERPFHQFAKVRSLHPHLHGIFFLL